MKFEKPEENLKRPIAWIYTDSGTDYLVIRDKENSIVAISDLGIGGCQDTGSNSVIDESLTDSAHENVTKIFYAGDKITMTFGFN